MTGPTAGDAIRPHDHTGAAADPLELLADGDRRRLLRTLADGAVDAADRLADTEGTTRKHYRHVHLPKLDDARVIEWRPATDSVEKGPRFDATEPLLRAVTEWAGVDDGVEQAG
ncbi:hypothetical protein [Halomarina litorea]|uniref:hypothetical protein n=1 Tax=Halomarina litorea TaxID=2961595 RepID=UPI0020C4920F|nr:hypothetical protein [Halomarina sp. BCD28]